MLWHYPENIEYEKVKVVRYCTACSKPWWYTSEVTRERHGQGRPQEFKMLVKRWLELYNDVSLDYKNTLASVEAKNVAKKMA
ncbi:galactinol synthase 4 [Quercus suber]|uniref:Galactinol synthase 4 n=1 Tax=Quercus suber TaxID=58331 RepID=A0AAW0L623_QUESU